MEHDTTLSADRRADHDAAAAASVHALLRDAHERAQFFRQPAHWLQPHGGPVAQRLIEAYSIELLRELQASPAGLGNAPGARPPMLEVPTFLLDRGAPPAPGDVPTDHTDVRMAVAAVAAFAAVVSAAASAVSAVAAVTTATAVTQASASVAHKPV